MSIDDKEYEAFEDTTTLITEGYLKYRTTFGGVPIIWKSITPAEVALIEDKVWGYKDPVYWTRLYMNLYSMFMVAGFNILKLRDSEFFERKLLSVMRHWPSIYMDLAATIIWYLNKKIEACMEFLEYYVDTPKSSQLWEWEKLKIKRDSPIEMSVPKISWSILMSYKDKEKFIDTAQDLAILVGSFVSPKQAKSMYNHKMAQALNKQYERDLVSNVPDEQRLSKPIRTREDLVSELEKQVKGVQDKHDKVIADYEMTEWRKLVAQHEEKLERIRQSRLENPDEGISTKMDFLDEIAMAEEANKRSIFRPSKG